MKRDTKMQSTMSKNKSTVNDSEIDLAWTNLSWSEIFAGIKAGGVNERQFYNWYLAHMDEARDDGYEDGRSDGDFYGKYS